VSGPGTAGAWLARFPGIGVRSMQGWAVRQLLHACVKQQQQHSSSSSGTGMRALPLAHHDVHCLLPGVSLKVWDGQGRHAELPAGRGSNRWGSVQDWEQRQAGIAGNQQSASQRRLLQQAVARQLAAADVCSPVVE